MWITRRTCNFTTTLKIIMTKDLMLAVLNQAETGEEILALLESFANAEEQDDSLGTLEPLEF